MEFKHTLVDAQEARRLAQSEPGDMDLRFLIIDAINDAIASPALTATVSVAGPAEEVRIKLLDELIQLGYAVDGTTTPNSFIITW